MDICVKIDVCLVDYYIMSNYHECYLCKCAVKYHDELPMVVNGLFLINVTIIYEGRKSCSLTLIVLLISVSMVEIFDFTVIGTWTTKNT
ncbi:hypothetical protein AMS59_00125 [Lysinibacillus sp. FJAT-14745]|nr:hypothetical protein AMS59_00125 [Lysinibacillus sp. FJAT-14745]